MDMEVYRSGQGEYAQRALNAHFQTLANNTYGSVSKWSWQYAQRAIMPTSIAIRQHNTEVYRSGHNGPHSKCGNGVTRSWVRIPPLPPSCTQLNP